MSDRSVSGAPAVSVIIIFLNADKFLEQAIESVLAQRYPNFELLLVDPAFERVGGPYAKSLARLGITMRIRVIDSSQYVDRLRNFDFDMIVTTLGQSLSPGNEQREYWGSHAADEPGSRNYMGVRSKAIDALIEQVIAAPDREALITARRMAAELATRPNRALQICKRAIDLSFDVSEDEAIARTLPMCAEVFESADCKEGVR